ncbi:pantoate--beta-alanine ligase [Nocardioides sp. R-C-SC26]|uniref:pantoate--beta-alanine ligase n=1 Tax=Nocardioides sp. R-C-SC26 TaxID=2870414 RepID=UPI001E3EAD19|nr:pantoate--beta-alanine ligase [Nocardioides sp. R-C-SC26]
MTSPTVASTRGELAELLGSARGAGHRSAFVPTMGALHDGHASLMQVARAEVGADAPVVVSIFVNPLQFGAGEDLDRYPRTWDSDLEVCARQGVDVVFAPSVDEVYPGGTPMVTVSPGPLAEVLEGRTRPGHFAGVLTVVAKLFGLVRPDVAVFGQKDYQQLVLIRRMVADLCLGVDVVGAPTLREDDGLAMSSRNVYLDGEQRRQAAALSRTLRAVQDAGADGLVAALDAARTELRSAEGVDLDYLAITTPELDDLTSRGERVERDDPDLPTGPARALIAARIGTTRLIDNLPLTLGPPSPAHPENHRGGDR